jgi:hypothetical protein
VTTRRCGESVATSLPWIAGILLTDIFAGTSVLALHLLLFAPTALGRGERAALVVFVAFAASTHSATFAVLAAIVAIALVARLVGGDFVGTAALRRGAGAIALGAAMLLTTNFALSGQLAWTPGGYGIVFARMLQDGIVARYLDDHCPERKFKLCPYRHKLPATADAFLWSNGTFNELGRFAGLGEEMRTIVIESLAEYPVQQIEAAVADTVQQLALVESGEGVVANVWHTYGIIDRYMPTIAPAMRAARQQHGELDFRAINTLHVPIALLDAGAAVRGMVRAARGTRRSCAACRNRCGGDRCQRGGVRGAVQPAQSLWRSPVVDGDVRGGAGADARCSDAAAAGGDRSGCASRVTLLRHSGAPAMIGGCGTS